MSPTYRRVRDVLVQYMSGSVADAVLAVACRKAEVSPKDLDARHLEVVLQQISHGIRLFCLPDRQGEMMLALAKLAE
jgi:hypothetical protein